MAELILVEILFPSLRNVAIIEKWKLIVETELKLLGKDIYAGILHDRVICYVFFYLKLAMLLFGNLNHTVYDVVLEV